MRTAANPQDRVIDSSIPVTESGCWIWEKSTTYSNRGHGPYGCLTAGSRKLGNRKTMSAHRYSYEAFVRPIPKGLCVCHRCDVPLCVNPDHLFLGTIKDNILDMMKKGRHHSQRKQGEQP